MSASSINSAAPHTLPWFVTAPGGIDTLYVITVVVVVAFVVLLGVFYFWLHALPERKGHKKVQFEVVCVLALIAMFTHQNIFWIIALLLALIDLPDFSTPREGIADAAERMASTAEPESPPRPETTTETPSETTA